MTSEIQKLEDEIINLEKLLQTKKNLLLEMKAKNQDCPYSDSLSTKEVVRYSRQMIMPQITKSGQIKLKQSKVLIVGAGGLGCPAALYLTAAGVGELHIADYDKVDLTNLHRQVLHYESDLGQTKVQSAANKLESLNKEIKIVPLQIHASSSIAEIIKKYKYDVVLDCSDNAPTRYLLNDVCVFNNIPLVSGSALQMEGQLTVYHYNNGPCYRCLFPIPPPAHAVTNCGDGGILGPVAGVIGVLQALETIKVLLQMDGILSGRLLLFDGSTTVFRNIKLRQRIDSCKVCGDNPQIVSPIDYEQFCGSKAHDKVIDIDLLAESDHIGVQQLPEVLKNRVVVDVRSQLEFEMCRLPNTVNLPFAIVKSEKGIKKIKEVLNDSDRNVYLLCRRGNDSQRSVEYLKKNFPDKSVKFINVRGGLHAYSKLVDSSFPVY